MIDLVKSKYDLSRRCTMHHLFYHETGDFKVDEYVFEVRGRNKTTEQIKDLKNRISQIFIVIEDLIC